jgi:hypothetical protein
MKLTIEVPFCRKLLVVEGGLRAYEVTSSCDLPKQRFYHVPNSSPGLVALFASVAPIMQGISYLTNSRHNFTFH